MECPIKPYGCSVVIIQDKQEKKTKGGIILDQVDQVEKNTGEVVAVSYLVRDDFVVGEQIIFRHHEPREYVFKN